MGYTGEFKAILNKNEFDSFGDVKAGHSGEMSADFRIIEVSGNKITVLFENPYIKTENHADKLVKDLTGHNEDDDLPDVDTDDI